MTPAELVEHCRKQIELQKDIDEPRVVLVLPRRRTSRGRVRLAGPGGGPSGTVMGTDAKGGVIAMFLARKVLEWAEATLRREEMDRR